LLTSSLVWASGYTIPNTSQAGSPAIAEEVNNNFTSAKTAIDDNDERIKDLEALVADQKTRLETVEGLQARIEALEANSVLALDRVVALDETATPPTVVFMAVNVQIVNGQNAAAAENGTGNLVIGYNETGTTIADGDRTESHNLVLGTENKYQSHGGIVAGTRNTISAAFATVTAGNDNTASGLRSSVSGGGGNTAGGIASSVSGGTNNTAFNPASSVSGGDNNFAGGLNSSISGGRGNTVNFQSFYGSISGGADGAVDGNDDWRAGTLFEED
jgi:hypothetical protein